MPDCTKASTVSWPLAALTGCLRSSIAPTSDIRCLSTIGRTRGSQATWIFSCSTWLSGWRSLRLATISTGSKRSGPQ